MKISGLVAAAVFMAVMAGARPAQAQTLQPQERLCDPSFQNCRTDLLTYINQETVGIDAGFWLMDDDRYATALINRFNAGVPVRILMDPRCVSEHEQCQPILDKLKAAGLPMRNRVGGGILHWKMMLFAGQGQVEFAGANYVPFEFVPVTPYVNYTSEVIYYTDDQSVVQSFMRKFDDLWTSTSEFTNYANVTGPLVRKYPTYTQDPELNFPPEQSYRNRAVSLYNKEMQAIDVIMFRITDVNHTNAMVKAVNRGVPVRLITDETEYRNPNRLWDAYNVDIMYHAGVKVKLDAHQGIDHEKAVILYGQATSIIGSSNWTSPSTNSQREHNYFTVKPLVFNWLKDQFNRKWNNSTGHSETKDFVPLPPGTPKIVSPANGAIDRPTTGLSLRWDGGLWGQIYDVYFGTSPNPPLLAADQVLGPDETGKEFQSFSLPTLQPGTKYYWKIVSKTMAFIPTSGAVWSFTTTSTGGGGGVPAPWADADVGDTGVAGTASYSSPTFTVTGAGADVWGTADALNYVYQPLSGDGTITARVASVQNVNAWTKAGVMIRASLGSGSAQAFMLVSAGKGVAYQRRLSNGATSISSTGSSSVAPRWVRLTRSGNTIAAFESANGSSWTPVGSSTFTMPASVLVGLGVSSHVRGANATATFDNVTVTAGGGQTASLPEGWDHRDIGAVKAPGNASYSAPVFTVSARGADIWGTADAFHYAYTALVGDAVMIARVPSVSFANAWSKAGIMVRETLAAGAKHATILVSAGKGVAFQRRPTTNGQSVSTSGTPSAPPRWLKLERNGNTFTASESPNGSAWTPVGTTTITMASSVFVGLAVTSHSSTATSTATFDNVSIE
jgi:regulation of enolase protein 1 (concanavalin A-like superfamily)/phosphatidylserine/phosphatidylglycerophosphate/cardiolipin synthase-like enzyme